MEVTIHLYYHRGYMSYYPTAKELVDHVIVRDEGTVFASWS